MNGEIKEVTAVLRYDIEGSLKGTIEIYKELPYMV